MEMSLTEKIQKTMNDYIFDLAVKVEKINPKCSLENTLQIWCEQQNFSMDVFNTKLNKTINSGSSMCKHIFTRGKSKGSACGKPTNFEFCPKHKKE